MHLRVPTLLIGTALVALTATGQEKPVKPAENVETLTAKNIEAKGGAQALQAMQSLQLKGKLLVNNGQMEMAYSQTRKRPENVRSELTLQGMTMVQAYDGKEAWKISPFQGRKDPEKMSADDTKSLIEEAEVDGPLIDWKEKGSQVEYLGTEDVDGTQAHKLKVTRKNGDVAYVYLDPDHFLEIRILSQRTEQGNQVEVEIDLSDYEKVNGVFVPFSLESAPKGASDKAKIIIEKAEANVPLDDAVFKMPATAPK
jgi:hypothetical protein